MKNNTWQKLIVGLFFILCTLSGCRREPYMSPDLDYTNEMFYTKNSEIPYTGNVKCILPNGQKVMEFGVKDGKFIEGKKWDVDGNVSDFDEIDLYQ